MRLKHFIVSAFFVLGALQAQAQIPSEGTRTFIRGTVEKLDGQTLAVKSREGTELIIALAPNFTVSGVAKRSLSDVKEGDYVTSTSVKGTDGKLHAIEMHIFPEAMRGTAEGQFPWDLVPDGIMTNATVAGISAAPQGQVIKVTYKGNESEIIVPSDIPIVTYVPGDASLLKRGAAIFTVALKKPDGTLTAARVTAEKDGVKPPM
jgi:hypothetical protein